MAPRRAPGGAVYDVLAARGTPRRVAVRTAHFLGATFVVAGSDLLLTAPARLAEEARACVDLAVHPPPFEVPPVELMLAWHGRTQADAGHTWLRTRVIEALHPPGTRRTR